MQQKVPFQQSSKGTSNTDRWTEQLDLNVLLRNDDTKGSGSNDGQKFDYREAFEALDLKAVKRDLLALITDSEERYPVEHVKYEPFFIRMAWLYSTRKYYSHDYSHEGTCPLCFTSLNSWLDIGNLKKVRQLLWPIKQKYKLSISWADLIVLTGNVALESMGFDVFGFAGGREDVWEAEDDPNWENESTWLSNFGHSPNKDRTAITNRIIDTLGAVEMDVISVNSNYSGFKSDPLSSARNIRTTFRQLTMNDEETVALIAMLKTFGTYHLARNSINTGVKSGMSKDQESVMTSGLTGYEYFKVLFRYKWELVQRSNQWKPEENADEVKTAEVYDENKGEMPMMLTSDIALVTDPEYSRIAKQFLKKPDELRLACGKAWYKVTHRDLGPYMRCLGPEVPEPQLWQELLPPNTHPLIDAKDQTNLKKAILETGISPSRLVATAWASASTFRNTDKRGGVNGARICLAPQKDWAINEPKELAKVIAAFEGVQSMFNNGLLSTEDEEGDRKVSMADLIVLGGCAGVEAAAKAAGYFVTVPFTPGRTDATQIVAELETIANLEPWHDGFRNYLKPDLIEREDIRAEKLLVDKAHQLCLTVVEMTVLVGGLRSLGIGMAFDKDRDGSNINFTNCLTNNYFVSLLNMERVWTKKSHNLYEGKSLVSGQANIMGTSIDLAFCLHSLLRGLAEVHACLSEGRFVESFCLAFAKVMDLDRFDVHATASIHGSGGCDGTDAGMHATEDNCSKAKEIQELSSRGTIGTTAQDALPILYPWSPQPSYT